MIQAQLVTRLGCLCGVALLAAALLLPARASHAAAEACTESSPTLISADLNGDGLADSVTITLGDGVEVGGRLVAVDGSSNAELYELTGLFPNDGFGFAVLVSALAPTDQRQLFVTSPKLQDVGGGMGLLTRYAGLTGAVQGHYLPPPATRIGLRVTTVPDQDGDAVRDVMTEGARLHDGTWIAESFIFSGMTGRFLASRQGGLSALRALADEGTLLYSPADMDDDGVVRDMDLVHLVGLVGAPTVAFGRGDLNGDSVINSEDVFLLVDRMLAGERTVVSLASSFMLAIGDDESIAQRWLQVFGDAPLAVEHLPPSGGAAVPPEQTPPPPTTSGGGGESVPGVPQGDPDVWPGRHPCLNASPGPPNEPCRPADIAGCPERNVVIGAIVELDAVGTGAAACTWELLEDGVLLPDGPPGSYRAISAGEAIVRMNCPGACPPCQQCRIRVSEGPGHCAPGVWEVDLFLGPCPQRGVPRGNDVTLRAIAYPAIPDAVWDLNLEPQPIMFDVYSSEPSPVRGFRQIRDQVAIDILPDVAGEVTVVATYRIGQCVASASCSFVVDTDRDRDGLADDVDPDPTDPDVDDDGFCDGCETPIGVEDPAVVPAAAFADSDRDGLTDIEEQACNPRSASDSQRYDSDRDGLSDMAEIMLGLDPFSVRTRGPPDRLNPAFAALDLDHDLAIDEHERRLGLDPTKPDSDGDGVPDGVELARGTDPRVSLYEESADTDGDGISDYEEVTFYDTDPNSIDSDLDGLPDGFEAATGLDPRTAFSGGFGNPNDADADSDFDGLSNLLESVGGVNPLNPDSDGDGTLDGAEYTQGSLPGDPSDGGRPLPDSELCYLRLVIGKCIDCCSDNQASCCRIPARYAQSTPPEPFQLIEFANSEALVGCLRKLKTSTEYERISNYSYPRREGDSCGQAGNSRTWFRTTLEADGLPIGLVGCPGTNAEDTPCSVPGCRLVPNSTNYPCSQWTGVGWNRKTLPIYTTHQYVAESHARHFDCRTTTVEPEPTLEEDRRFVHATFPLLPDSGGDRRGIFPFDFIFRSWNSQYPGICSHLGEIQWDLGVFPDDMNNPWPGTRTVVQSYDQGRGSITYWVSARWITNETGVWLDYQYTSTDRHSTEFTSSVEVRRYHHELEYVIGCGSRQNPCADLAPRVLVDSSRWRLRVGDVSVQSGLGRRPGSVVWPFRRGRCYTVRVDAPPGASELGYNADISVVSGPEGPSNCCKYTTDVIPTGSPPGGSGAYRALLGNNCVDFDNTRKPSGERRTATICLPILRPDPATHEALDALTILPGDVERVYVGLLANTEATIVGDTETARFVTAGGLSTTVTIQEDGFLEVRGLKNGVATIIAGPCSLPVHVGGTITVEYDRAATFKTNYSVPLPGGGGTGSPSPRGPAQFWWDPVLSGSPDRRPPMSAEIIQAAHQLPAARMTLRVEVRDARGRPKSNKALLVLMEHGVLVRGQGTDLVTDDRGRVTTDFGADEARVGDYLTQLGVPPQHWAEAGSIKENLAVLVGRACQHHDGLHLIRRTTEIAADEHVFTGHSLRYSRVLQNSAGDTYITAMTLDVPVLNHAQYHVVARHLVGYSLGENIESFDSQQPFNLLDPLLLPGDRVYRAVPYGTDWPPFETFVNQPHADREPFNWIVEYLRGDYDENPERYRSVIGAPSPWTRLTLGAEAPRPDDPPPGWTGNVITVGAILTELGIGMIPIVGDGIDVFKEAWKFAFTREGGSWTVIAIATVGIAMDLIPGNVLGNFGAAVAKVVVKRVPEPVIRAILSMRGSLLDSARALAELISRIPTPPGMGTLEAAAYRAATIINQLNTAWHSKLQIGADKIGEACSFVHAGFTGFLSDEGFEGLAGWLRHGGANATDSASAALQKMIQSAGNGIEGRALAEESMDAACTASGKTLKRAPSPAGVPDAKDLQRVAEGLDAAGRTVDPRLASYVDPHVGPEGAFKTRAEFENARFQHAESLTDEQRIGINLSREAIPHPERFARVMPLQVGNPYPVPGAADTLIQDSVGSIGGSLAAAEDVAGMANLAQLRERLRLDYPGSPYEFEVPYAVLETSAAPFANTAKIPRSPGFQNGSSQEFAIPPTSHIEFPSTGNGYIANREGRLVPEWGAPPTPMMAGEDIVNGVPVPRTTMRLRHASGEPYPLTIGGRTASDWKLMPDVGSPTGFSWEPLP